jgi:hypothetical protein
MDERMVEAVLAQLGHGLLFLGNLAGTIGDLHISITR